jgi:hypothetical protein
MSKYFLLGLIMLGLSTASIAAEPNARGFYIGGAVGAAEFDDDGFVNDLNNELAASVSIDDSDTSYMLYGGYKILKYLAVEGRLSNLGSYKLTEQFAPDSIDFDVTAFSAHVVGIIPFGASGWELFGQLGLARLNLDVEGDDTDETAGSAGLGVRWYPITNLGLSLQVDAYVWEDDSLSVFGGPAYDLAVGTTQFAVHWLF